jgi:hypothetical protein
MTTFFDVVTVTCFAGLIIAFFQLTDRHGRTVVRLLPAGIVFAIANQVGNAGGFGLSLGLIVAGIGYAILILRK